MKIFALHCPTPLLALLCSVLPNVAHADVPLHIPTWAYDEYWAEGANASSADVGKYVTYAEGGLGNGKAPSDCFGSPKECYSVWYLNPHLIYDSPACPQAADQKFLSAASENWFVHEQGYNDSSHRVEGTYPQTCQGQRINIPVYVANFSNPAVIRFYANYLQRNADQWDYYFLDDSKPSVVDQMYGPSGGMCRGQSTANNWCNTTQEFETDQAVMQAHSTFVSALNHRNGTPMLFFLNGMRFSGTDKSNDYTMLEESNRFLGASCENCAISGGTFRTNMYRPVLDAMAQIDGLTGKSFLLLDTGSSPPGSSDQIEQRLVTTAIVWLGYRDGHTVVWPNLEDNTKGLAVWPEDEIYPSEPLESMAHSASDIEVAPGIWRREFARCYNARRPIGPCAAVLNSNASPVVIQRNWLRESYGHTIQLDGGDILSGGSISMSTALFTPNVTSVPGGRAVLLAR
jgi:hypothetical protein